jgi:hypothetical protein
VILAIAVAFKVPLLLRRKSAREEGSGDDSAFPVGGTM